MWLRTAAAVAAALLATAGAASAADGPAVPIRLDTRGCLGLSCRIQSHRGSGVVVGKDPAGAHYVVLTAGHVVEAKRLGDVVLVGWEGTWRASKLAAYQKDGRADLAALYVPADATHSSAPIASADPAPGSTIVGAGFAEGTRWMNPTGVVLESPDPWLDYSAAMPEGTSGGPIRDAGGAVVAIHMGIDSATRSVGMGTPASAIRTFCRRRLGYVPGDPSPPPSPAPAPEAGRPPRSPAPRPAPCPPPAVADCPDVSGLEGRVSALEGRRPASAGEVEALRADLDRLARRPIVVEILDPNTGQVRRKAFPAGEPIRLKLPRTPPSTQE